jgi:asparagine synthase (glutamine-hydrolysing)
MCGIAGYLRFDKEKIDMGNFKNLLNTLTHRGPDDSGHALFAVAAGRALFTDNPERPVDFSPDLAFGHRRLSILDLSEAGRQPMSDESGSLWIVYNGEVYNYKELRDELRTFGHTFRTNTDTEVIIKAYSHWGRECLGRFNGMFAFALWDVKRKTLFCARDRMGVKPFYYWCDGRRFAFASEIKALLKLDIERSPNKRIVYDYLSNGILDHTDETFFSGIKQLPPAHFLFVSEGAIETGRWWDIENTELPVLSDEECGGKFLELFEDSIRLRLRSDVPIGTCLSGGLDSSAIVCLANALMFKGDIPPAVVGDRQRTFSSCFEDRKYDERVFIEEVVRKTGAGPYYVFPDGKKLFDEMPRLVWHQDEPFGSTSIFAQWNVMRLASGKGIKVLLDGQGADELLAGYHGYFGSYYVDLLKGLRLLKLAAEVRAYKSLHGHIQPVIFASVARALLPGFLLASLRGLSLMPRSLIGVPIGNPWLHADFEKTYKGEFDYGLRFDHALKNQLYTSFTRTSLPALLHYEDRNAMAFSIETRVPFLDYRLVEYVFSLPGEQKLRNGMTKIVLRNAMKGVLPEAVRTRVDKMGFVTPEDVWFRTILKDRITEIIESTEFRALGYFDVREIRREFESHVRGEKNISFTIWRWINLFLWENMFIKGNPYGAHA